MQASQLTETQARRLAQLRVKKGVAWLHKNAPHNWQWNMFLMAGGGHTFVRAHDAYDNECVLALAFTNVARFANTAGYVTYASVKYRMNLPSTFAPQHGFAETRGVSGKLLDAAWAEALTTYAKPDSMIPRHTRQMQLSDTQKHQRLIQMAKDGWFSLTGKTAVELKALVADILR